MTEPAAVTTVRALPESDHEAVPKSALAGMWGIGGAPWLWGTRIRILFVIDGRINEDDGAYDFGLGGLA